MLLKFLRYCSIFWLHDNDFSFLHYSTWLEWGSYGSKQGTVTKEKFGKLRKKFTIRVRLICLTKLIPGQLACTITCPAEWATYPYQFTMVKINNGDWTFAKPSCQTKFRKKDKRTMFCHLQHNLHFITPRSVWIGIQENSSSHFICHFFHSNLAIFAVVIAFWLWACTITSRRGFCDKLIHVNVT